MRYSSRDGHAEEEHVNRGRDTPSLCPTLQVLDMFTLGDAADVNPVIKFLPHTLHVCGRNYCTAEVGNPGGTYELLCIFEENCYNLENILDGVKERSEFINYFVYDSL